MQLSCRILSNVQSVNSFDYADAARLNVGDTPPIYIQLVDLEQDKAHEGFCPAGRRYMPEPGATLEVVFDNVDSAKKVTRLASPAFPGDLSIWRIQTFATDNLRGTITLKFTLTEGNRQSHGTLKAAVLVR